MKPPPQSTLEDFGQPLPNHRHEAFVRDLAAGLSQRDAYLATYPRSRSWKTANAVDSHAAELAGRPYIKGRLAYIQTQAADGSIASLRETLQYYTRIMRARPTQFLKVDGSVDLDKLCQAKQEVESVVVEESTSGRTIKFKLRDGIAAATNLAKLMKWEPPKELDVTSGGQPLSSGPAVIQIVDADGSQVPSGGQSHGGDD